MNKLDIYFFSGTGNTFLAVKKIKDTLQLNGKEIKLHRIEKTDPLTVKHSNPILFAFPVAALSTFPFVLDFLRQLPQGDGTEVYIMDTLAGRSGAVKGPLNKLFTKKNYKPKGAAEIIMPENIFYILNDTTNKIITDKGLKHAEQFALQMISDKTTWAYLPLFSDLLFLFYSLLALLWKIDFLQALCIYKLDKDKCTKCGLCERLCPVMNIKMKDYPEYSLKCEYCLRCVSFCPQKALNPWFNFGGKTYKAADPEELLNI